MVENKPGHVTIRVPASFAVEMRIGAIGTALILGEVGDVRRFKSKHHFGSYTGTAPIDVSSGDQDRHRLNRGGNRQLNYALHVAALVQIRTPAPARSTTCASARRARSPWRRCGA
jgi:transposase